MNIRTILLAAGALALGSLRTASPQDDAPLPQRPKGPGQTMTMEPAGAGAPLSEDEKIVHFLNRFTPGATPALVAQIREVGIAKWFEKQLKNDVQETDSFHDYVRRFETIGMSCKEVVQKYNKDKQDALQRTPGRELQSWILARSVYSNRHVREVSADFFRNHFSISLDKDDVKYLATDWEREVIRDNALGNFGTLLAATAHHPAMLYYLDNHLSRSPPPAGELRTIANQTLKKTGSAEQAQQAVNIARQRGLNENYGRELMELHTLGVDRHYTQDDVVAAAKCLTGWTINRNDWSFAYNSEMHCSEKKLFLGASIAAKNNNSNEGEAVLEVLKMHRGTAQFLAWKLCRYFVNDEPDPAMVKRVAAAFSRTHGDLPKVYQAIATDPEFYQRRNFRDKYKRPYEFVTSALRVTGAVVENWDAVIGSLDKMNESPYRCQDPTGYYDQAEAWRDPGAIATRWIFATELVNNQIAGIRVPDTCYKDLAPDKPAEWKDALIAKILPAAGVSEKTYRKLTEMIDQELRRNAKPAPAQLGSMIVGILLGSPDFQKQ